MPKPRSVVFPVTSERMSFHQSRVDLHRQWLSADQRRLERFDQLLCAQPESAICEALVATQLRNWVDRVEAFEDLALGGPDYRCIQNGEIFYVESTCLRSDAVTRAIKIEDAPLITKTHSVGSLAQPIFTAVNGKIAQSARVDGPVLIAIGVLHRNASVLCINKGVARDMLISDESYVVPIPAEFPVEPEPGFFATGLRRSVFLQAFDKGVQPKRQQIAGIMLLGFAKHPPDVVGVINDRALHPFNSNLLPHVPFAQAVIVDERVTIQWWNREPSD